VETRTGRSDGDERNMGDEVLGLGVFLYRDEATKMIVALMREREFFFFWMSNWRLASKGGSASLPHPLLLYTSAPDPFAGGGCRIVKFIYFSVGLSPPLVTKNAPNFSFRRMFLRIVG
jgi:hypothetical protein